MGRHHGCGIGRRLLRSYTGGQWQAEASSGACSWLCALQSQGQGRDWQAGWGVGCTGGQDAVWRLCVERRQLHWQASAWLKFWLERGAPGGGDLLLLREGWAALHRWPICMSLPTNQVMKSPIMCGPSQIMHVPCTSPRYSADARLWQMATVIL